MKIGVDDFLVNEGKDALISRIRNPAWKFDSKSFLTDTPKFTSNMVEGYLRGLILSDALERSEAYKKIKELTKLNIGSLKEAFLKIKRDWKKFQPPFEKKEGTLYWDRENETLPHLYTEIGKVLTDDEDFYINPDSDSLFLIHQQSKVCEVISTGIELASELSHRIQFQRGTYSEEGFDSVAGFEQIPSELAESFLRRTRQYTNLLPLNFYSLTPTFVHGSLVMENGYCPKTKVYYAGKTIQPKNSTELLETLLNSFPFADESSRANALALILMQTFFLEEFRGGHPMGLLKGDAQNLGKTTFVKCVSLIASGRFPRSITYTPNDEELEKRIATEVKDQNICFIDNVRSRETIKSAVLERSMTDEQLNFRQLGTNRRIERPGNVGFFMTLNEGALSQDLIVRALPVLFSEAKRNRMKLDFEPTEFVRLNREELLAELIGMVKRWEVAETSTKYVPVTFPKFKSFASLLNGILLLSGFKGFLANYEESLAHLDALCSAILQLGVDWITSQNISATERWFPSEWAERLAEKNVEVFLESKNETTKSRSTRVGLALSKMKDKTYSVQNSSGELIKILVSSEENPSRVGGNAKYRLSLKESANPRQDNDTSAPSTHDPEAQKKKSFSSETQNSLHPQEPSSPEESAKASISAVSITPEVALWSLVSKTRRFNYKIGREEYQAKFWNGEKLNDEFSFDLETELIVENQIPSPVLGSAFDGHRLYFLRPQHLDDFRRINLDAKWLGHNIVFDIEVLGQSLGRYEAVWEAIEGGNIRDTMILARLLDLATSGDPAKRKGRYRLGTLCKRFLSLELPKDVEINGIKVRTSYSKFKTSIEKMPDGYFHYNAFDTIATFFLAKNLESLAMDLTESFGLKKELLLSHDIQLKSQLAAVLTSRRGLQIDTELARTIKDRLENEIQELTKKLENDFGYSGGTGSKKKFQNIISSEEQKLGRPFTKVTRKSGKVEFSEAEEHLNKFADSQFVNAFLEIRTKNKLLKTYILPNLNIHECHPRIDMLKATGRTGIQDPPLQTFPKMMAGFNPRKLIRAREGHKFIIVDFVGAELVTLAQTCLDLFGKSNLAESLNAGEDVHRKTAAAIFKKTPQEISKEERQHGKAANFSFPGGMTKFGFVQTAKSSYGISLSEDDAERIMTAWLSCYPEMNQYLEYGRSKLNKSILINSSLGANVSEDVQRQIFLGIVSGRNQTKTSGRFYTEKEIEWAWSLAADHLEINSDKFGHFRENILAKRGTPDLRGAFESGLTAIIQRSGRIRGCCAFTDFCNNSFQGLLSDIAKVAWYELQKSGFSVVNFIHDEIVCEVPFREEAELNLKKQEMVEIMLSTARKFCPDVKMNAEARTSFSWGE